MSKYERISSSIRELANHPDPSVMANALTKGTEGLHHIVPGISQALQVTGSRALNYLHDKMPKPVNEMVGDAEYEPSKTHQREWLHLHDIVDDPVSVLDHVRHGTLTSEHMDALSQVHPELLDQMRQQVMENMDPNKVKKLPSTTKIALGTFLGSPITESVSPQAILANQVALQGMIGSVPGMQSKSSKSSQAGLKELKLGDRASTQTEELESDPE